MANETGKGSTAGMPEQAIIDSFIANSFRSVWALDLLSHLAAHPAQFHSPEDLVAILRASDAVVSQSVQNLAAAGLAIVDERGQVAYHQGTPEQAELVGAAIDYYGRSPDKVRRLIVAQAAPGVTAFADAFKLRKD
jgi:hypothetical protein